MILCEAEHIKYEIQDRILFQVEKLQVHENDRIGLVGKNGSGKSTLLEVLAGNKYPESGTVLRWGTMELLPQLKRSDAIKSGGEVTQEYINDALSKDPAILLADEPTTHLDTSHIEWIEKKLKDWQGAFILVSHDRAFLDAVCTKIWEIRDGRVKEYTGNYSDYYHQKEIEFREQELAYEKYQKKKRQLEEALKLKERKAARATKTPKKISPSEAKITGAKPYFAKKQKKLEKNAKAIETRLEKLEKVEKVREQAPIQMDLPNTESLKGRVVIRVENLPGEMGSRVLWKRASFSVKGGDKLAVIGANGSGKTTLIKRLLKMNHSQAVKIGYFSQNIDTLDVEKSILDNVISTSNQTESFIRTVLARLHFKREEVNKPVHVLSGGERMKVALAKIFVSDVNTLILDEPTNFLDIESVEALESLLKEYEGTVIFVSHDRRFVAEIATRILTIENNEIKLFEGSYHAYKSQAHAKKRDVDAEEMMVLETRITEVLSRLSIEPSEELEREFQRLLTAKKKWEEKNQK